MTYERTYDPRGYKALDSRWLPYIDGTNPLEADAICEAYDRCCQVIGYDSNAAIAQGCVETARFTSPRWHNSHNAAGIGIYEDSTEDIIWGPMPNGDVQTGVEAQIDLLTDYYTDGSEPYNTLAPHGFGGMVLGYGQLCDMDGVWAADTGYSAAIVDYMNTVIPEGGGGYVVTTKDVMREAFSQYGHEYSGDFDTVNGNHPWAYWCLSFCDSAHRQAGLNPPLYPNAVTAGRNYDLSGGVAPFGSVCFFDEQYYAPDGHACLSIGGGWMLSTVEDGTGVGIKFIPSNTIGYMGHCFYDGVSTDINPDPAPNSWYVQPDNPYSPDESGAEVGIGHGFLRYYRALGVDPMVSLGYAEANECDGLVDGEPRTIQRFERGTLVYDASAAYPWDVVVALESSTVEEAT